MIRRCLSTLLFLCPASGFKNAALRQLGNRIGAGVRIGPTLAFNVDLFDLGAGAIINFGNVFREMELVSLGEQAIIGQWNWFSSVRALAAQSGTGGGKLVLGDHAAIVSRHHLDCSGGIRIREFAILAGLRSTLLTHGIDYRSNKMATAAIEVGQYALVNSSNNLVPGASVPANSITGMAALILPGLVDEGRLYLGVPAKDRGPVKGEWFHRQVGRIDA